MENCISNKFGFSQIKSEYLVDWLNLLCNTDYRYKKFIDHFLEEGNLFHSACRYQKYLREEEGRGKDIKVSNINEAVENKDIRSLNNIFQEIFIEPIDNEAVGFFIDYVKEKKFAVDDFINFHKNNIDKGFWLTLKKLIN